MIKSESYNFRHFAEYQTVSLFRFLSMICKAAVSCAMTDGDNNQCRL